jgi:hypothetical protein
MKESVELPIGRQNWESLLTRVVPHDPQNQWYLSPNIPQKKLDRAIRKYASGLQPGDVLALMDGTVFGSAHIGVLLTTEGLHYRRSGKGGAIRWSEISEAKSVGSAEIDITTTQGSRLRISCGVGLLVRDRLQKLVNLVAHRGTADANQMGS